MKSIVTMRLAQLREEWRCMKPNRARSVAGQEGVKMKSEVRDRSETERVFFGASKGGVPARLLSLMAVVLGFIVSTRADDEIPDGKPGVETMTVNLYIGGGTEPILALDPTAPDYVTKLVSAVTGLFYEIVASQPNVRLAGVADTIVARTPDIVAVEEATLLRNQSPGDLVVGGSSPATNVVYDYVEMLVNALQARGAHYAVASTSDEWDVEMPMVNLQTGTIDDVRQTDREAILVRTDLPPGQLRVAHPMSGTFSNVNVFPQIGLRVARGWCSVDAVVRGRAFRFICAHLEEETAPQIQVLQARELLCGPARTRMPVLLCGDFNSDPLHRDGSIAYETFTTAGFHDAWAALNPLDPAGGLTWGHDELLADPATLFDRRIDLVFYKGRALVPVKSEVVDLWLGRDEPPLWSSDHAAVVTRFCFQ